MPHQPRRRPVDVHHLPVLQRAELQVTWLRRVPLPRHPLRASTVCVTAFVVVRRPQGDLEQGELAAALPQLLRQDAECALDDLCALSHVSHLVPPVRGVWCELW